MIWTIHARCHWKCFDFKPFVVEAKQSKDKQFGYWRVTSQDRVTLMKGKTSCVKDAMNAAVAFAESISTQEKTKSQIVKEFCEERGIEMIDLPMSKIEGSC